MAIRRFDHRARFRAAYLNNAIDQVNQMNRTRFQLFGSQGGSGNILLGGNVSFSAVYQKSDYTHYCPAIARNYVGGVIYNSYWLNRMAVPTWGNSILDARSASQKAEDVRYQARAGYYDQGFEDSGWGGFSVAGVDASTYLTEGAYPYDDVESRGYKTADVLEGYNPETNPYPGGGEAGYVPYASDSSDWADLQTDACNQYPSSGIDLWLGKPTDGWGWLMKNSSGGIASVYPEDPGGLSGGGNYVYNDHRTAGFNVAASGAGFPHVLCSLPPGAVVTKALLPIKLSDFSLFTRIMTSNPVFVERILDTEDGPQVFGGQWNVNTDVSDSTSTSGSIGFVLMGRYSAGTFTDFNSRIRRQTGWEVLANIGGGDVSTDTYSIVDVTDLCNQYLNEIKTNKRHFEFAFFPSSFAGAIGEGSMKDWLAGMCTREPFELLINPHFLEASGDPVDPIDANLKDHGYANFAPPNQGIAYYVDTLKEPDNTYTRVSWGSLVQGEGIIEWQYPSSLSKRVITYSNIVRGDSPILG